MRTVDLHQGQPILPRRKEAMRKSGFTLIELLVVIAIM
jgi:competence protein ComGC